MSFSLIREVWRINLIVRPLTYLNKLVSIPEQLYFYNLVTMAEQKEEIHFLDLANVKWRKDCTSETVERALEFRDNHILQWVQIYLFSDNYCVWIWRHWDQECNVKKLQPAMKHSRCSIMVWETVWNNYWSELVECEGNIKPDKYMSILQKGFLPIFSRGERIKEEYLCKMELLVTQLKWLKICGKRMALKGFYGQTSHQMWTVLIASGI